MRDPQKQSLADLLLAWFAQHPPTSPDDVTYGLAQLPPHPADWDDPIRQSALTRWLITHAQSPLANLPHPSRPSNAERYQRKKTRRDALNTIVTQWQTGALSDAVAPDGVINLKRVRQALTCPLVNGKLLSISIGRIKAALMQARCGVWDPVTRQLMTPEAYAQRLAQRETEHQAAEQRFQTWTTTTQNRFHAALAEWSTAPDGTPESTILETLGADTPRQRHQVEHWLQTSPLVSWSTWQIPGTLWGSRAVRDQILHARHLQQRIDFLTQRHSTLERTQAAWEHLGGSGDSPWYAFYAPEEGLPVFTSASPLAAVALVSLDHAGLFRAPAAVSAVALLESGSSTRGRRVPLRELYRARDLQPASTQLLVSPTAPNTWLGDRSPGTRSVTLHVGPTNAGKTHAALRHLVNASTGAYLAPLRLLAWEAFTRLNAQGIPTDLLTGEESLTVPGARLIAATIEMLPRRIYDVVVIDEAQLIGDYERGGAWARALLQLEATHLEVCCAPEAEVLLTQLLRNRGDTVTIVHHDRLGPLTLEPTPWTIQTLPVRSAVVAFSRTAVLRWKAALEHAHPGTHCAVIYGALPPDVRQTQIQAVLSGEAHYVAATDAIGLGLNLPLDHIAFAETDKFDGTQRRPITPQEMWQIAGRAGRYGLATGGTFGGITPAAHYHLTRWASKTPSPVTHGVWQPTFEDLAPWPWRLSARLRAWQATVAPTLPAGLRPASLASMLRLADALPAPIEQADRPRAYRLITAPVSDDTLPYWHDAVTRKTLLKAPVFSLGAIQDDAALRQAEISLHEHDLCLWFARHQLFSRLPDLELVIHHRTALAHAIQEALRQRSTSIGQHTCAECGDSLPPTHFYALCETCYSNRRVYQPDWWDDDEGFY